MFSTLEYLVWFWTITFLLFVVLTLIAKSSNFKGWIGEERVNTQSKNNLPTDIYHAFHDILLADDFGTTQIDHIYISKFGIFVVETKNYTGWIFGKTHDKQWVQNIYGKKYFFQNPIRQNYRHIKALEATLNLEHHYFHSVIVFTGDCELKSHFPDNVCYLSNFTDYILSFNQPILDEDDIPNIINQLTNNKLENTKTNKQNHIKNLKNHH